MKDHVVMIGLVVIQVPMTVEITEEDVILRKMIGSVQPATMSTSLGELNATVVEKRRKGTSRRTNPQDGTTTVQISDVNDLVKKPMGKTIGNALPATTSTSRSEQNAIAVENRSQVVEAMIVHVEGVILTDVEDSVEIEMEAEVLVEIVEGVILTVVVEAETVDEASEEIEEGVILTVVVEAEVVGGNRDDDRRDSGRGRPNRDNDRPNERYRKARGKRPGHAHNRGPQPIRPRRYQGKDRDD